MSESIISSLLFIVMSPNNDLSCSVTRKRKRRTRSVRRSGGESEGRTGTGAGMKENVPAVRRVKTRNEIATVAATATVTASLIVRKET